MAIRRELKVILDLARGIDIIDYIDRQLLYNVNRVDRLNLEIPTGNTNVLIWTHGR